MKWGQYNDSLGIQNKMLNLYDRQAKTDELKANAYINSLGNNSNNTNLTGTLKAYDTLKSYIPMMFPGFGNIRIS